MVQNNTHNTYNSHHEKPIQSENIQEKDWQCQAKRIVPSSILKNHGLINVTIGVFIVHVLPKTLATISYNFTPNSTQIKLLTIRFLTLATRPQVAKSIIM